MSIDGRGRLCERLAGEEKKGVLGGLFKKKKVEETNEITFGIF